MNRRGMTLIEVLISIGLVAALLGAMFSFFFDLLGSRRRALESAARQSAATLFIERLEHDLASCIVGDTSSGAGVEGDATRLTVRSRSVAAYLAEKGLKDPKVLGDLQVVEYRGAPAGMLEARRGPKDEFAPFGPVGKLRLRYHDGKQWRDSYDSLKAGALPVAVEVALWLFPLPGAAPPPPRESARRTFDDTRGFDEASWDSDLDSIDEPMPDRLRVIPILDAAAQDPYAGPEKSATPAGAPAT